MSDVSVSRRGSHIYPNMKSYRMSASGGANLNQQLAKGTLFSVRTSMVGAQEYDSNGYMISPAQTEIDTTLSKEFQFNPPELNLAIQYQPVDPEPSMQQGGNYKDGITVGIANTAVEMLFSREQETYLSERDNNRFANYQGIGVIKDILDVYAVIKGDAEMFKALNNASTGGTAAPDMATLTQEMFDLAQSGSPLLQSGTVALKFSQRLVLYGRITSMSFRLVKFNRSLIPTMGYVDLQYDIMNTGSTGYVSNLMAVTGGEAAVDPGTRQGNTSTTPNAATSSSGWDAPIGRDPLAGNRPI